MALYVNPVSVARTFTTLSGRTLWIMQGQWSFDHASLIAACHDKSCAPPPVGTGGSSPEGDLPNGANPDRVAARLLADRGPVGPDDAEFFREEWGLLPSKSPVVRIRVNGAILGDILRDGFLTQHDTGTSQGFFDPDIRDSHEEKMFDVGWPRPVYGYIGRKKGDSPYATDAKHYGDVVVELKDSVNARTTVTCGDSLYPDLSVAPVRLLDAMKLVANGDDESINRLALATTNRNYLRYFEAQVHGPIAPTDISKIHVPDADTQAFAEQLKELHGLDFEIVLLSPTKMASLACEAHGEFACHDKSCAPPPVGTGGSKPKGGQTLSINTEHYAGHLMAAEHFGEREQKQSEELWGHYPENPVVRIRLPWDVLEGIHAAGGRFLTQHETGTSRGIFDPELRTRMENRMFGQDQEGHPVYGYIGNAEGAAPLSRVDTWSRLACYGEIGIELKSEVHARTTVLMGDSLGAEAAPILMGDVHSVPPIRRGVAVQWRSREQDYSPRTVNYIEAQIHGGLSMSDVRRIIVPSYDIAQRVERMFPDIEVVFDREVSPTDPVNFSACEAHGEFACHDKSCAPPPVGTGGSKPEGGLPNGANPDKVAERLIQEGLEFDSNIIDLNWTRYPSNPVVRIRVPYLDAFENILAQGFKTQHQTGDSMGLFDPDYRDDCERNMFEKDKTRPIYGYVANDQPKEGHYGRSTSDDVTAYGSIVVELKPSVHERTTVTFGDSLGDARFGRIAPLRMTDVVGSSQERKAAATVMGGRAYRISEYIETQIHGGVTVDDIKRVYVMESDLDQIKSILRDYPDIEVVGIDDLYEHDSLSILQIGFADGQWVGTCEAHGEFACHDKSCAPPPVGTGGSKPEGGLPNGANPDKVAERLIQEGSFPSTMNHARANWNRYPTDPVVRIRVPTARTLRMIIASGFKTQHETGESKGTFNPSLRDTVEQNMFGAPNTRPVYGYIAHGDSEDGQPGPSTSAWVAPYGSIVIELKPSVHERTTVTCGDSLDKGMSAKIAPVRMGDIPKSSHDRGRKEMQRLSLAMDRSSLVRTTDGYFEAQIHGQLTANDIKRVIVKPLDYDAVKEMLKDHPDIEVVRSPDDGAHYSFAVVEGRWVSSS